MSAAAGRAAGDGAPRISVVIPTYQRRDLAVEAAAALGRQRCAFPFEAIVVVDGSADGSAEALRGLTLPFPLKVLEQSNQGAASARNRGAAAARGEILLFLDDDMEADPDLLAEHDRSHREGAEVVIGHLPLHPCSPANLVSAAVGRWADNRLRALARPGAGITYYDLLTGQISLASETFRRLGGFDGAFTRDGTYGDEDLDFGARLLAAGLAVTFNPRAVSWQRYVVTPREHLRQWRATGRADVAFARKHPTRGADLFARHGAGKRDFRLLWRPVVELPWLGALLSLALTPAALAAARGRSRRLLRVFLAARALAYWRGVREGGGIPRPRPLRVLAYHAIADLQGDRLLAPYGIPPARFRDHLRALARLGYRLISPAELARWLAGGGLPRRPVLLTFDDAYEDLLTAALPALTERGVPAIAFAASGALGGSNTWDERLGARRLPLLDAEGLRRLAASGIEIGAHSRTHARLPRLPDDALPGEIAAAADDLAAAGLPRPRFFAYPYGEHDDRVRRAVAAAGLAAAFTVRPGLARPGADPLRLPRIEILRADAGWRFRLKLALAPLRS